MKLHLMFSLFSHLSWLTPSTDFAQTHSTLKTLLCELKFGKVFKLVSGYWRETQESKETQKLDCILGNEAEMPKLMMKLESKSLLGDQIWVKCTFQLDCQVAIVFNGTCAVHKCTCTRTQTHNAVWFHSFKAISVDTQGCLLEAVCDVVFIF